MAHVAVKLVQGVAVATIHNPPVNGLSLAVRAGLLKALEQAHAEGVRTSGACGIRGQLVEARLEVVHRAHRVDRAQPGRAVLV